MLLILPSIHSTPQSPLHSFTRKETNAAKMANFSKWANFLKFKLKSMPSSLSNVRVTKEAILNIGISYGFFSVADIKSDRNDEKRAAEETSNKEEILKTIKTSEKDMRIKLGQAIASNKAHETSALEEKAKVGGGWFGFGTSSDQAKIEAYQKNMEEKVMGLANALLDVGLDTTDKMDKMDKIEEALEMAGVEKFTPTTGELYDGEKHHVQYQIPELKKPPGIIVHVARDGYCYRGRVIRRAEVTVTRTVEVGKSKNLKL